MPERPVFVRAAFLAVLGGCALLALSPLPWRQERVYAWAAVFVLIAAGLLIAHRRRLAGFFSFRDAAVVLFLAGLAAGAASRLFPQAAANLYLSVLAFFVPVFLIARMAFAFPGNRPWAARALCTVAVVVAVLGLIEVLLRYNPLYALALPNPYYERYIAESPPRPCSTLFNPAVFGSFLAVCLPFCACLSRRWLRYLSAVVLAAAVMLSFSRGAFITLAAAAAVYFISVKDSLKRSLLAAGMLAAVIGAASLLQGNPGRIGFSEMVWGSSDGIFSSYRAERLRAGWQMFRDFPWQGVGLGNYRVLFPFYSGDLSSVDGEFCIADNMYVTVLAESGIAGLCGLVLLLCAGISGWRKDRCDPVYRAGFASFCALAVGMASYELFYWPSMLGLFAVVCAVVLRGPGERR